MHFRLTTVPLNKILHRNLIQSGMSHVFVVYSEPIEIAWQYHLSFYLSYYPIRDDSLYRRYTVNKTETIVQLRLPLRIGHANLQMVGFL